MNLILLLIFILVSINLNAQSDFPDLKRQFLDYRKADKQDSALFIARKMNQLALLEQTDTSYWFALSFKYLGNPHNTWGNKDSTISYWKQSIDLFEKYHQKDPDYIIGLNSLGNYYKEIRDYKTAETYYKSALNLRKKLLGENHSDYASSIYNLGFLYKEMGDFKSAEPLYKIHLEIKKNNFGEMHPEYAVSLNNLGFLYSDIGKYDSSILLIKQSIKILWENFKDSSKIINEIHSLAFVYNKMGKYPDAEEFYYRGISLLNSKHSAKKHFTYKYDLAENYIAQAKYDVAIKILFNLDSLCSKNKLLQESGDVYYSIGKIYSKKGNYELANDYYYRALNLRKEILPANHSDLAVSYNSIAVILYKKGLYSESLPFFLKALEIRKVAYGDLNADVSSSMMNIGVLYETIGDYRSAEKKFKECLKIQELVFDSLHPKLALTLGALGDLYLKMGLFHLSDSLYKKCLLINKISLGINHPVYASLLDKIGDLNKAYGDFSEAQNYYFESLKIYKELFGENHPSIARVYNNLGDLYLKFGNLELSEDMFNKDLNMTKSLLGESHPDYAKSMNSLAYLQQEYANYDLVNEYLEKAITIRKNTLGIEHPDYIESIRNKAIYSKKIGEFKKAKDLFEIILDFRKLKLGENHPDYATSLIDYADIMIDISNFKMADSLYTEAKEIIYVTLGDKHMLYAISLYKIGRLHSLNGDYKQALIYYSNAYELRNKILYPLHPDLAVSINSLSVIHYKMGEYEKSISYSIKAMDLRKKVLGVDHPDYASSLNNLGVFYKEMGDYNAADAYLKQALEIKKKALGEEHPDYAGSLNNLGNLYKDMGYFKASEEYLKQALEIKKKALGEEHPDNASSLNGLGNLYKIMGDYKAAEPYYIQALVINKKALGEEHPKFLYTQNSFAYLLLKTNRELEAYNILNKNFSKKSKEIADNFEWLNDNQKEAYWKKESAFYDNLSCFANEAYKKVPEAAGLNYNSALVTKSKMLEAKISSENYYREVDELREQLAYRIRLLAKMESDGSTEKEKLGKLHQEADSLDKRLTQSWPEYAQQKKNLSITWDQVQQILENGEAAIEFVRFKNEDDSLYYYNALVIRKGDINPTLIKLCKEEDLRAISPKMGFSAYYPLVWQPIEAALKDIVTIYYAPVGELYNIAFSAIYSPKGSGDQLVASKTDKRGVVVATEKATTEQNAEYLMDRYTMHQLTSTRYLAMGLKQKAKDPIANTIAMVGGVNYDYLPGSTAAPKKNKKDKNASRSSASTSGKLNYLEGTKTEVEQIHQKVITATWQTKLIEKNDATEETITKLEGKEAKRILHIATHGYAFPEFDFKDTTVNKNSLRYSYRYSTNPMVRSGLILAGGNWAWTGSDTLTKLGAEQNGILTALEVSQLNLKKTKLVVLSACETGLGKIEGSEGTFGLKRGFKLAGVEQIIVSLWSVPDKETMELMTLFYSDLTKTLNPVISFSKAQKEMRNLYPTDPEKWAGFVLVR